MHDDVLSTIIISLCKQLRAGELSATDQFELSKFLELTSELIVVQNIRILELESNIIYCIKESEILKQFISKNELQEEFKSYWTNEWSTHLNNFIHQMTNTVE